MAIFDDHLEKLLEGKFSPKSLFLAFRNDTESLLEMLLYCSIPIQLSSLSLRITPSCVLDICLIGTSYFPYVHIITKTDKYFLFYIM